MATTARRTVRRELLERISRPLLARILSPFAEALRDAHIDHAALAASHDDERSHVHAVCDALNARPARLPPALRQIFVDVGDVATRAGQEELAQLDVQERLPRGTLGAEDFAALAWLEHPDLFLAARVRVNAAVVRTWVEHEAESGRPLVLSPERLARVEALLAPWLVAKNRTEYVRVFAVDGEDRVTFEIAHGRPPGTRDVIDPSALVVRRVTDVTAQRSFAIVNRHDGRLAVHGVPALREVVRRALGEAFFGAPDHYRGEGALDLAPLFDPDAALACIPGIDAIELRAVTVRGPSRGRVTYDGEGGDVRSGDFGDDVRAALQRGIVKHARIDVRLEGRTSFARVDLGPGAGLHFDRDDEELERTVRALLAARRILRAGGAKAALAKTG
jgi:hypothetical protein